MPSATRRRNLFMWSILIGAYSNSVRSSVCPSVRNVPVLYQNGVTLSLYFRQHMVPCNKHVWKIPTGSPVGGRWVQVGYMKFAIFCPLGRCGRHQGVTGVYPAVKKNPPWNLCYATASTAGTTGIPYVSWPTIKWPSGNIPRWNWWLCRGHTRGVHKRSTLVDLLAIAKFLVFS